jgi:hypothetical protein
MGWHRVFMVCMLGITALISPQLLVGLMLLVACSRPGHARWVTSLDHPRATYDPVLAMLVCLLCSTHHGLDGAQALNALAREALQARGWAWSTWLVAQPCYDPAPWLHALGLDRFWIEHPAITNAAIWWYDQAYAPFGYALVAAGWLVGMRLGTRIALLMAQFAVTALVLAWSCVLPIPDVWLVTGWWMQVDEVTVAVPPTIFGAMAAQGTPFLLGGCPSQHAAGSLVTAWMVHRWSRTATGPARWLGPVAWFMAGSCILLLILLRLHGTYDVVAGAVIALLVIGIVRLTEVAVARAVRHIRCWCGSRSLSTDPLASRDHAPDDGSGDCRAVRPVASATGMGRDA